MTDALATMDLEQTSRWQRWLRAHIVWLTDVRRDLHDASPGSNALAVIVGREHYREWRRRYPIGAWRDLDRVLTEELAGGTNTLALIGPPDADGREVTFYEFQPAALASAGRAPFVLPESVLLARSLPPGAVATVERDGLRYFVNADGISQPAAGTVQTADLFAFATGTEPSSRLELTRAELPPRFLAALRLLGPATWIRCLRPGVARRWNLDWKRVAYWCGGALAGYLLFASLYLQATLALRERELAALGPEVQSLLDAQREVDALAIERGAVAALFGARQVSYHAWQIVASAWASGAVIDRASLVDGVMTLRGSAPAATEVLAAITGIAGVSSARFSAPVRNTGNGAEEFSISMTLAAGAVASGG